MATKSSHPNFQNISPFPPGETCSRRSFIPLHPSGSGVLSVGESVARRLFDYMDEERRKMREKGE